MNDNGKRITKNGSVDSPKNLNNLLKLSIKDSVIINCPGLLYTSLCISYEELSESGICSPEIMYL